MIVWIRQREDPGREIWEALRQWPAGEQLELRFESGDYYFRPDRAITRAIYISNATTVQEGEPPTRQIGMLLEDVDDVICTGNDTTLWFDGRMSEIVIQRCKHIVVQGFTLNFVHPSVFEFDVVRKNALWVDIRPVPSCEYALVQDRLTLPFDNIPGQTILQVRDARRGVTKRIDAMSRRKNSVFSRQLAAKRLPDGCIRVLLPFSAFRTGMRYQLSNPFRDSVGTLIDRSEDVTFRNNTVRYMHGLGVTAQLSKDVSILDCDFLPDAARNITTCAAADMIHVSLCTGLISVRRCRFEGARDDVINVHGVHFRVVRVSGNEIDVAFCQGETYGFLAFDEGDTIEFVDPRSLASVGEAKITAARMLDLKHTRLTLDRSAAPKMCGLAIENVTKNCDLIVDDIDCCHIPTRGILVSTRGKVVIRNSRFFALPMANVLIADDASGWFESGRVCDVLIEQNYFDRCGAYTVDVFPETRGRVRTPVHSNIRVVDNKIILAGRKIARVKDTDGFVFAQNEIEGQETGHIRLINCRNSKIEM